MEDSLFRQRQSHVMEEKEEYLFIFYSFFENIIQYQKILSYNLYLRERLKSAPFRIGKDAFSSNRSSHDSCKIMVPRLHGHFLKM